ncbi:phosphate uptake regulator PhoU [Collinsella tanakaei]|uniref:PhoU domain-containing protein n=1 Tax=Collinsella ihumii TaxID=1720204 RepID=A0AAW7K3F8_9ACTN|nr:PhoU domain-containing protein [Collinsella ihumii]MBM6688541.1 phosphate uptake regulator PhoU [Collinsella tanakaei]MBM6786377.1 phosphate uptake regulator PhoU [Collinsella tanakaei]MBM6905469.1 phosphate uptake regulator PhoU [Collinsella tanakaei]MCF6414167.1 phosphate uptake regulator PhoU [Collinsella tanakaei]MDN0055419.1 PhoU domain-containing protein [Collinsella ihumii]
MRKMFSRQLVEARHEMLSIYEALDLTMHDAVRAFVTNDKKLASKAQQKTLQIDARCANLEAVCYNLIATQSPVASDFRLLQTVINIEFNLQRICDKVRRIARAAKHKVSSDIELPAELVEIIEQEASYVYKIVGRCISVLVCNDLSLMRELLVQDDTVHELYEEFFRAYNRMSSVELADDSSYDDLRRAIMVSRYLDRIASISIDATSSLSFLLTGQRLSISDIAEIDEDELESMRIPSGEDVILQPVSDARYVSNLPEDEITDGLKALIARAAAGDDDEVLDEE